jgi:hypothetical protein
MSATELKPAPASTNPSRRDWRRLLWIVPLLLALLATTLVAGQRAGEEALLRHARRSLDQGQAENAERDLTALVRRPLLSRTARWDGAELFFRVGEDHAGNALLKGAQPDPHDPRDRQLLDLAARCQRALLLLARANRTPDPKERLDLAREALAETPDSPLVLQRVVEEELLQMTRTDDPRLSAAFEADYRRLRIGAPRLADELKQRVARTLGERTD